MLPLLSEISVSLCSPNFSLFGDVTSLLRASLWPASFSFEIASPETLFEVGRDRFDCAMGGAEEPAAR
jgi:hypothetical protein